MAILKTRLICPKCHKEFSDKDVIIIDPQDPPIYGCYCTDCKLMISVVKK